MQAKELIPLLETCTKYLRHNEVMSIPFAFSSEAMADRIDQIIRQINDPADL